MSAEEEGSGASVGSAEDKELLLPDEVFLQLMAEVQHAAPGARLSARLRTALERIPPRERAEVCSLTSGGRAPLFVAALRGNAEVVEYLVHVGGAPLEQRGPYDAVEERAPSASHSVTPLWAAAVAGQLEALRVLADAGAEIDARSDSGSTPLRSACFMTHLDVVRFLCESGADPCATNHNGGTCLINSVQSPRLCRYLLARGVPVDARDAHGKTALHYAVQEHRGDTAGLLLAAGADPRVRSVSGDDALRTAATRGAAQLVEVVYARNLHSVEQRADALELLGATQLDELEDATSALQSWRRATALRHAARYVEKRPPPEPCPALGGAVEWRTERELDVLSRDTEAMSEQALLVAVRVLGPAHKDTVFRLMYRGAAYADSYQFRRCVDLWTWALEIRIAGDTLLHTDTSHTLCALTRLMVETCSSLLESDVPVLHAAAARVLRLVARAVPESQRLTSVRPWCGAQAEAWERALRCVVHLVALADVTAGTAAERAVLRAEVRALCTAAPAPATHPARDSLLHLACSRLTVVRSAYLAEGPRAPPSFPCARTVRLLLECGAEARARNALGRTPLHTAAAPGNFSSDAVEALLAGGAHLCAVDSAGDTPAALLSLCRGSRVCPLRHVSLACLAARALVAAGRVPAGAAAALMPRSLLDFLDMHRYVPVAPR